MKHTKGDWVAKYYEAEQNQYGVYGIDINFGKWVHAATVWIKGKYADDEEEANISLIEAAPDLLDLLIRMTENFNNAESIQYPCDEDLINEAQELIRDVTL